MKKQKRSYEKFVARLNAIGANFLYDLERRAKQNYVTLQDLYEGPDRAPSIAKARRDVYTWLSTKGKGNNEIARLFDRAPSGVQRLMLRKSGKAA